MVFENKKINAENINASSNFGFRGGNILAFDNCESDSFLKYCQGANGTRDAGYFDLIECESSLIHCNFINDENLLYIFYVNVAATFIGCIFIDCVKNVGGIDNCNFIDCFANKNLTFTSLPLNSDLNKIKIDVEKCPLIHFNTEIFNFHELIFGIKIV